MPLNDKLDIEKNVKKSGSSFYWGMKLLPEEKRRAMFSIYAFCREVDDIADDLKSSKTSKEKKPTNLKNKKGKTMAQMASQTAHSCVFWCLFFCFLFYFFGDRAFWLCFFLIIVRW